MKKVTLFTVPASHPCATVERVLAIKGVAYRKVEWPQPFHVPLQKIMFGVRTVPAVKIDGERISGSIAIVRKLEELVPEPALFPTDPDELARVEEAELWGADVLQPLARRVLWQGVRRAPRSLPSFLSESKLPVPAPIVRLIGPAVTLTEISLNKAVPEAARRDLHALPTLLDKIERWIEDGVLGGVFLNAADLQIASSLRLLMTLGDLYPLMAELPAGELALRIFPEYPGDVPAGALPEDWLGSF